MPANATDTPTHPPAAGPGSAGEVLVAFLKLGCTSFGGPVAHLGFFRTEFVQRRRWLDDAAYGDLVALAQFLPGPTSSQVGLALGWQRAGWRGALAAWLGFTLPSALLLIALALGLAQMPGLLNTGAMHGLKLAAVAVVAQAVWGMGRTLCPDAPRLTLALAAAAVAWMLPTAAGQLGAMVLGAVVGRWWLATPPAAAPAATLDPGVGIGRTTGLLLLGLCAALLLLLPAWAAATQSAAWQAVAVTYQAGALVFGGGHVVLPLLQGGLVQPGLIAADPFLAGYGAAQAVPGPLFTLAAFLGAALPPPLGGVTGGLALLVAIFLPGVLLMAGALPWWQLLRQRPGVQRALTGVNAAVVGLLLAALVGPVGAAAIGGWADAVLVLLAWALLVGARLSPVWVVLAAALAGTGLHAWAGG